ncbi:hypothetical protein B0A55_04847 [Friedmanniomyces simplex]|uniref:FAD-binding domain-containing protein n=1 Tax=Friedmanniomyces simplex TaxID=329884 RepID=A0A4U0XG19_9PEZI|nr:hypothetical protein B0A55_04847 [Friedmanniomyces simplex]
MGASNFKVIVVGGGPIGLTAAAIDFPILEHRSHVIADAGSNLVLMLIGLRAISQLDLLDPLNAVSSPLSRIDRLDHDGRDVGDVQFFTQMEKNFGVCPRVISRHDLTRVLYNTLPSHAQQKVLTNKKLSDITPTVDGATVTRADGSSYEGAIVFGADGAHSTVREAMRRLSLGLGSADVNEERPFMTT